MPLGELAEVPRMKELLVAKKDKVSLTGCVDSQKVHMMAGLGDRFKCKVILTFSDLRAREIAEDFLFYDRNVFVYPGKDLIFYQADIHGHQLVKERMNVLKRVMEGKPITVITTFGALMSPMMPIDVLKKNTIEIDKKTEVSENKIAKQLVEMGYEKNYQVDAPGQFSVRGGIIDVFDLTQENPYRIELWGEEVESIRSFDLLSQRSIENLESICIYPATELILTGEQLKEGLKRIEADAKKQSEILRKEFLTEEAHRLTKHVKELKEQVLELSMNVNLESYINYFFEETGSFIDLFDLEKTCIFMDEPTRIREHADGIEAEFRESMSHRLERGYVLEKQANILYGKDKILAKIEK